MNLQRSAVDGAFARPFLAWAAFGQVCLLGCTADPVTVQVQSFDQAQHIAFLCFETEAGTDGVRLPVALERCAEGAENAGTLHAVVTQGRRGELASVDLSADLNNDGVADGEVLDLDVRLPGFTFSQVGELPSAVVVPNAGAGPEGGPTHVFVANRGSRTISIVPVDRLVRQTDEVTLATVPDAVPVGGAAVDLMLNDDETRLFAAVPELAAVLVFEIGCDGGCLPTPPVVITLPAGVASPVTAVEEPDYCFSCSPGAASVADSCGQRLASAWPDSGLFQPRTPTPEVSADSRPRPVSFEMDAENGQVLVADEALPFVHVLDATSGAFVEQFSLSVAVSELALTPPVAALVGQTSTSARYLYAIDANDQSVLVADYATKAVLPVSVEPGVAADRITLDVPAVAIEVASPLATSEQEPAPTRLNGVYLIVAGADGFMRFVDVEDREIESRSDGGTTCLGEELYLRRHRRRLALLGADGVNATTNPRVTREGEAESIASDGSSNLDLALGNVVCGTSELAVFSSSICATFDPWSVRDEVWRIEWEGTLPTAVGARGTLSMMGDGTEATMSASLDFCRAGVLGGANSTGLGGPSYGGDVLVLSGTVPPVFSTTCEDIFLDEFDALGRVAIPILESFEGGLRLGVPLPVDRGGRGARSVSYDEIVQCFGNVLGRFEVRVSGRYLVTGSVTALRHPVVPTAAPAAGDLGASCGVDPSNSVRARAPHGQEFTNGRIRFRAEGTTPAVGEEVFFTFGLRDSPTDLRRFVGTLPSSLTYSTLDQRLYAIDSGSNGLVPYQLTVLEARSPIN